MTKKLAGLIAILLIAWALPSEALAQAQERGNVIGTVVVDHQRAAPCASGMRPRGSWPDRPSAIARCVPTLP